MNTNELQDVFDEIDAHRVSKKRILELVDILKENSQHCSPLVDRVIAMQRPGATNAAWLISHLTAENPELIKNEQLRLLEAIPNLNPDGLKRDILRAFFLAPTSGIEHGRLIDLAFNLMTEGHYDLAVKYNAMRILVKYLKLYPELKNELFEALLIQSQGEHGTFPRHAARTLKKLRKKYQG